MAMVQRYQQLKFWLYKLRAKWRKRRRLWFPSPAEVEFIRIMGGKYITLGWITDPKTKFPFTFVWDLGTILKREGIEREVRVGAMYLDFATVGLAYQKGIEIDGRLFHQDIVHEIERDEYVADYGYSLLHINASDLYRDPTRTQQRTLNYLAR